MDDLVVRPIATSSTVTLLNKYKIKDVGDLEEKVIAVGISEGVKLLKASLQSTTVLADVFLEMKLDEAMEGVAAKKLSEFSFSLPTPPARPTAAVNRPYSDLVAPPRLD
ncbi:hypothetical protein V6N13_091935 [Hibiscus sabdariffa]